MQEGRAVVGSLALHVAALAALAHALAPNLVRTRPAVSPVAERIVTPARPSAAPIAVELLDAPPARVAAVNALEPAPHGIAGRAVASASRVASPAVDARSGDAAAGAATSGAGGEAAAVPGGRGGSRMTMRGPELHPDDAALEPIAGTGDEPTPVHRSGRLEHAPGGGGVIRDRVADVTVERDGTAHFHDKPDIDIHLRLPIHPDVRQDLREIGKSIADWYADPYAGERYGRTQDLAPHLQAEPGQCDTYGDSMCDDALAPEAKTTRAEGGQNGGGVPIAGGAMDLTAYLMRKFHVGDPYASRKRKLLDDTIDERAQQGGAYRAEQLSRSAELMRANLDQLRAATPTELREALFELWDECAEGEGPTGEAGTRARAMVIGWIRARLPAGSAGAYTPAEIAALDARRSSTQHFAPYEP